MAAGTLALPGSPAGPCEGDCEHTDCAATRRMAEARCPICTEPIGYDTRFYRRDLTGGESLGLRRSLRGVGAILLDQIGTPYVLEHALCRESSYTERLCPSNDEVGEHNLRFGSDFCDHPGCPNYRSEAG